MKNKKYSLIFCCLFFYSVAFSQEYIDLQYKTKPYYSFAGQISLGFLTFLRPFSHLVSDSFLFQLQFLYHLDLWDYFFIHFTTGLASSSLKNQSSLSYQIAPVGIGPRYEIPLNKNFFLFLESEIGSYLFQLEKKKYLNPYIKAKTGFFYDFNGSLGISFGTGIFYFYEKQKNFSSLDFSLSLRYAFDYQSSEKDIQIQSISIEKIFASLYPTYAQKPAGIIEITNISQEDLRNIEIAIFIEEGMKEKSVSFLKQGVLKKQESARIPLYLFFHSQILSLQQNKKTTAILEISYEQNNKKHTQKQGIPIFIYGRNAMIWDNMLKLGSFITVQDKTIIDFSRKSLQLLTDSSFSLSPLLNSYPDSWKNIVLILENLRLFSLQYVKDPHTSYEIFGNQSIIADYIQYPAETLLRKTGDCDDLTLLVASLLESIGIETALVSIPGHIFLLAAVENLSTSYLIDYQNKKWIPLETTAISEGFTEVWKKGYANFINNEIDKIILTNEALRFYPAVYPVFPDIPIVLEKEKQVKLLEKTLENMQAMFQKNNEDFNRLGIEAAKNKEYALAEQYFLKAIHNSKEPKIASYNLLRLYLIWGQKTKAEQFYQDFLKHYPEDTQIRQIYQKYR